MAVSMEGCSIEGDGDGVDIEQGGLLDGLVWIHNIKGGLLN